MEGAVAVERGEEVDGRLAVAEFGARGERVEEVETVEVAGEEVVGGVIG